MKHISNFLRETKANIISFGIESRLSELGFIVVDNYNDNKIRKTLWRQKDDNPKMDIEVAFINHNDNL